MRIFIDADGCPVVKLTVSHARKNGIPVTIVKNYAHVIEDDYAEIVTVDISSDAADYYIANKITREDILITQDYGLAAMALSKGAYILNQNGLLIHNGNIMTLLDRRHINQKMRKNSRIYTKIRKRTPEDDEAFLLSLKKLINDAI
ncbi:DUF188 domain-containing protein [Proteiniclasticum sp. C24MP]|uniref:YaiI/YqxD family protein n=1 Tax=Proteiniclasticum sp. C24MP TaxID=3374101 RepID=UPI0037548662